MHLFKMSFIQNGLPHNVDISCSNQQEAIRILFSRFPMLKGDMFTIQHRALL